eukprot:scaffold2636_cov340-Pavlova_lutheri.AAC.175
MALWFPAFPPAPTSMVRNRVTTMCSWMRRVYLSRTKDEEDCNTSSPSSHLPLDQNSRRTVGSSATISRTARGSFPSSMPRSLSPSVRSTRTTSHLLHLSLLRVPPACLVPPYGLRRSHVRSTDTGSAIATSSPSSVGNTSKGDARPTGLG